MKVTASVLDRYRAAAIRAEPALCCPVDYDPELLALLPAEIVEKDYGCGDPSRYVRPGDTVLDLGCGAGKVCYMAAQLAGPEGRVIGVDMNDEMLELARKYRAEMARRLGGDRVRFLKARIQDLALDLAEVDRYLSAHPLRRSDDLTLLQAWQAVQRAERPLIADASVDLVISNCVLNLVPTEEKPALVREIFRVLKPGGRVAISDIISDEPVPDRLLQDLELWSGCISGAFHERDFLDAFREAGFLAVRYDQWEVEPWRTVEGIEFRAATLTAVKGVGTGCIDVGHAVIYRGPYQSVSDDEGHVYPRGERMAVCERTFELLTEGPHRDDFIGITPAEPREPRAWCAPPGTRRPVVETKGGLHTASCEGSDCC